MFACCAVQDTPVVEPVIDDKEPMEALPVAAIMKENAVSPTHGGARKLEQNLEFTASFQKAFGEPLGLELDLLDGSNALIVAVDAGAVNAYNQQAPPERRVAEGDKIVAVNNVNGRTADMLRILKTTAITVTIVSARGLRDADSMPGAGSDAYAVCSIVGKPNCRVETPVVGDALAPYWNFKAELPAFEKFDDLHVTVWDKDLIADQCLGKATIDWAQLQPDGFKGEIPLQDVGESIQAFIQVEVRLVQQVTLVLKRPRQFRVAINKRGRPLGLGLNYMPLPVAKSLVVLEVLRGAIQDWNDSNQKEEIKKDHRIIEVNGFRGSPPELLEKIKTKELLEIVILAY